MKAFRKRWIWALPMALFALLGAAAFLHYLPLWSSPNASTASVRSDFSLQLQRAGSDYRVVWDAKAPAVLAAKRGTLFIKDGSYEKQLELDHEQLLSASVVYSPGTTDVSFRLELYGTGSQPQVANVRLLAGTKPEVAAEAAPNSETVPQPAATEPPPPAPAEQPLAAEAAAQPPTDAQATMAAAPKPEEIPQQAGQ